jgi:hypothetical protein
VAASAARRKPSRLSGAGRPFAHPPAATYADRPLCSPLCEPRSRRPASSLAAHVWAEGDRALRRGSGLTGALCRCAHIVRRCRVLRGRTSPRAAGPRTRASSQGPSTCVTRFRAGTLKRSEKASRRHALILWRAWRPSGVVRLIWAARAHVWQRRCGPACGLMTEVRPRWRGRSAEQAGVSIATGG